MKKVANFLRIHTGRKGVVANNYRDHVFNNSKKFDGIYHCSNHFFDVDKSNSKETLPVVWAKELFNFVVEERKMVGGIYSVRIKVKADGGQRFFKISFFILPDGYEAKDENECC